jgi:hypothetical protein
MYIEFCFNNQSIPKCYAQGCNSYYIISGLKNIPRDSLEKYEEACLSFFIKDHGTEIQKKIEEIKILAQLREERIKYLNKEFPAAIATVASWVFTDKIRKLEKQKKVVIEKKIEAAKRKCMNNGCKGFLSDTLECLTCATKFCVKCEVVLAPDHQCKQEDLDSVNMINTMVKCPGCKLPVFKHVGCNSITCANCSTHFDYITGEKGGHGSLNQKVIVNDITKLSVVYKEIPENCYKLLLAYESLEPQNVEMDTLLVPIKHLFLTGEREESRKQLAKRLNKYMRYRYINRKYFKTMGNIEQLIKLKDFEKLRLSLECAINLNK